MSGVHCFTSATFAYLDRARVLCETLRRFHPDWTLWLCLADEEPPGFDFNASGEQFDHVVRLQELDIPGLAQWVFDHDVIELCTAVKALMLCKLLAEGAEKVVYLDPDLGLFERLSPIELLLDRWNLILTPHQLEPDLDRPAILDNESCSLKHGIYNLGFLAVAATTQGRRFGHWWRERLQMSCFDDIPNGLF